MPSRPLHPIRDALIAAALGAVVTAAGTAMVERAIDRQAAEAGFHARASRVALSLATIVNQEVHSVEQLTAFLDATRGRIDGDQFRRIAEEIHHANPDLVAIEWVERIPAASLADHESAAQVFGGGGYQVTERRSDGSLRAVGARPDYFPVRYSEPRVSDRVIGFDLGSDSARRDVLVRATARAEIAASGVVTLVPSGAPGAIIAHPVFAPPSRVPVGFAVEVLRFDRLMARAAGADSGAGLRITVGSTSWPASATSNHSALSHEAVVPVADTSWGVRITPADSAPSADPGLSPTGWLALILGLATSVGLGIFAYWQVRSKVSLTRAKGELQRANTELEAAFRALPDLYFRLDAEGRFLSFRQGRSAPPLYRPPAEFVGQPLEAVVPPDVAAAARQAMQQIRRTGEGVTIEYSLVTGSETRWYETRIFAGTDSEFLLFARDVTDRRARERELAASEERFRTLIAALPEPLVIVEQGVIVFANPAAGYFLAAGEPAALVGMSCDRLLRDGDGSLVDCVAEGGAAFRTELDCVRLDGTVLRVEVVAASTVLDGRPARLMSFRDMTARRAAELATRQSEERFRELAESADGVFWLADVATREVPYVSPRFESVFGLPMGEPERRLELWASLVHPDDRDRVVRTVGACLDGSIAEFEVDYRIKRPDGEVRWINDRARRIRMTEGGRVLGFARDVTERLLAQESQASLEAQLRNLQKMEAIGTLAGGIAHDFNNILGAILGYASLLELQLEGQERARSDLNQILVASGRAKALVQQILTFSQQREQARSPIRLQAIIKEALALLRAAVPSTVSIEARIDAAPTEVMADGTQIHQVVMNLVTNAADALGSIPGTVAVRYERVALADPLPTVFGDLPSGEYACLTVRDDGPGMSPDTIERIFEPFFTTKPPGKGTGLGLAVVHGIVQAHAGGIVLESAPGAGTTVRVYLPLSSLVAPAASGRAATTVARGAGQRILIVDDEAPLALFCGKVLEGSGYQVATHTQPEVALAEYEHAPSAFDLALLDLTMPHMTGVTLAGRLRALRPDLPIILMTGYASTLTDASVRDIGVDRLLLKPPDLKTLTTAVADCLVGAGKAG
ncbi:MAG: CHASE domain-containing protein [Gemmatimonadales bacterium]|nr:CHASE domain-containing protein [Gemmatimonadales bacterium]